MSSRNSFQPSYVTMAELLHAIPRGAKRKGSYAFRHCDVCDEDDVMCELVFRLKAADGQLRYLCQKCWDQWQQENQHVFVMLELMG